MITVSQGETSPTPKDVQEMSTPASAKSTRNPEDTTAPTSRARVRLAVAPSSGLVPSKPKK